MFFLGALVTFAIEVSFDCTVALVFFLGALVTFAIKVSFDGTVAGKGNKPTIYSYSYS